MIVNSCVGMDRPKSAPSNLPKETAIKVRIAEFFVHHTSGREVGMDRTETYCVGRHQQTLSRGRRTSAVVARERRQRMKRKDAAEWIWSWQASEGTDHLSIQVPVRK